MKPTLKKTISFTILILIIALFIYYIKNHISDFKQIALINPLYLVPLLFISLIVSVTNGLIIKYLAEPFKIKLNFKEWFGLSIITTFYNMITPFRGGLAAKAAYMKHKHNFSYADYLATVAGLYVINFFVGSLLGLISLFLIYEKFKIFNIFVALIFLAFLIPMLTIIIFSPEFKQTKYNFVNKFIRVLNGWNIIRKERKIVVISSITIIAQILINCIATVISYHIFGINLGFEKALFLSTIAMVSILIQITPSGLGINEAVAVFSGLVIGITPAQSLSVAIVGRIVSMITIFTLGPIYSYALLKHKPKNEIGNKK